MANRRSMSPSMMKRKKAATVLTKPQIRRRSRRTAGSDALSHVRALRNEVETIERRLAEERTQLNDEEILELESTISLQVLSAILSWQLELCPEISWAADRLAIDKTDRQPAPRARLISALRVCDIGVPPEQYGRWMPLLLPPVVFAEVLEALEALDYGQVREIFCRAQHAVAKGPAKDRIDARLRILQHMYFEYGRAIYQSDEAFVAAERAAGRNVEIESHAKPPLAPVLRCFARQHGIDVAQLDELRKATKRYFAEKFRDRTERAEIAGWTDCEIRQCSDKRALFDAETIELRNQLLAESPRAIWKSLRAAPS